MNINDVKVRCFDAEFERDQLREKSKQVNGILTAVAEKLGVMQESDGQRVFDPNAVIARVGILIDNESELTKSDDHAATLKSKLEDIAERLGCSVGIDVCTRIDSLIKKARLWDDSLEAEPEPMPEDPMPEDAPVPRTKPCKKQ